MRFALAAVFAAAAFPALAVEEPPYKVVASWPDCELRAYPELTLAETTLAGARAEAEWSGFRILAGYIFGANAAGEKIDMVAPVLTTRAGEGWTIRFILPQSETLAKAPKPQEGAVRLRAAPATRLAVVAFSGVASDADVEEKTETLRACIRAHGLTSVGAPALAQYNAPWTLGPWRRNEVMAPVK